MSELLKQWHKVYGDPSANNTNLLLERVALLSCLGALDGYMFSHLLPEDFADPFHRNIFEAIYQDFTQHGSVDINRVTFSCKGKDWFEKMSGGYILYNQIFTAPLPYTPDHDLVAMLRELLIRREAKKFSLSEGEAAKKIIARFAEYSEHLSDFLPLAMKSHGEVLKEMENLPPFIPTGYDMLDTYIYLQPGNFMVVGGRTGTGKTSFLCNLAGNIAKDRDVLYCTKEMSHGELLRKFQKQIGAYQDHKKVFDRIICVENIATITDVEAAVRSSSAPVIFVDYIQILRTRETFDTTVQMLEEITKRLKELAQREHRIIAAASQLNRELDTGSRPPVLSDLRGCGSIEQDADIVLLLWNPSATGIKQKDGVGKTVEHIVRSFEGKEHTFEFFIAKNRSGPTGMVEMRWDASMTSFRQ